MSLQGKSLIIAASLVAALFCAPALAQSTTRDVSTEEANRKLVVDFYDSVFNGHKVADGAKVIADEYKQHNPRVPDGKAPFVSFFTDFFAKNPNARARIVRSAANGDLVWLHVHATNGADDRGMAIVDIFRVKDGRIVEHWDVLQSVPEKAANANTMF